MLVVIHEQIFHVVLNGDLGLQDVSGDLLPGFLDFVKRLHLVQIPRVNAALRPVERVPAVVQRHVQNGAVLGVGLRRSRAVACRVIVAGACDLLTADQRVVPGIPQAEAQFPHDAGDDDFVVLEQGETAHQPVDLDRALPQALRRILVDAQGDGGIVQAQTAQGLQRHVGDGIAGVLAGIRVDAADRGVQIGIADADDGRQRADAAVIEAVDLHEEAVRDLLSLIHGDSSRLQIRLQVRPGILVEAAERTDVADAGHADQQFVEKSGLTGLPVCLRRIL